MKAIKDGKAPVDEGTSSTSSQDDSKKEVEQSENQMKNFATPKNNTKVVGQVSRFQAASKGSHIIVVKRILQYLKGTTEYGLWYPKGNDLVIQAYTDENWTESVDDRKSASGATFYLGGCLVSWLSKKQPSISLSTAEAKYVATAACCTQVL
eukprot:PITA_08073